jgi:hypothetical protein
LGEQWFCLGIFVCSQSGDHPWEDLAKSGYKPETNYQSLFIFLYFWLQDDFQVI